MNNITTPTTSSASPLSGIHLLPARTVETKTIEKGLPIISVTNENCSLNMGRRASHSELSSEVIREVQALKREYLSQAIQEVENGGDYRKIADKFCIKPEDLQQGIHAACLKANKAGSAGALLSKGGNWQAVAKEHGISDQGLSASVQAFLACQFGKQAIFTGLPAAAVGEKYGITDEKVLNDLRDLEKRYKTTPENYVSKTLDAAVLHNKKVMQNAAL